MIPTGFGGRDSPDFGYGDVGQGLSVNIDGAELAARLGSPLTFSRTGNLLYHDTFDYGLGSWDTFTDGAGSSVKLYTTSAYRSPYCARLYCPGGLNDRAQMSKSLGFPYLCNIGVEYTFRIGADIHLLYLTCEVQNDTDTFTFGVMFNGLSSLVHYYASWGGWFGDFANTIDLTDYDHYHTVKVVVDVVNEKYLYIVVDNEKYSLEYPELYRVAGGTYPHIDFQLELEQNLSTESIVYIDDFIYTINEPT